MGSSQPCPVTPLTHWLAGFLPYHALPNGEQEQRFPYKRHGNPCHTASGDFQRGNASGQPGLRANLARGSDDRREFIYALFACKTELKFPAFPAANSRSLSCCFNALALPGGNGIFTATLAERITHYTLLHKVMCQRASPLESTNKMAIYPCREHPLHRYSYLHNGFDSAHLSVYSL